MAKWIDISCGLRSPRWLATFKDKLQAQITEVLTGRNINNLPPIRQKNHEIKLNEISLIDVITLQNIFLHLEELSANSNIENFENATEMISRLFPLNYQSLHKDEMPKVLNDLNRIIRKAWVVPNYGRELGYRFCKMLHDDGGIGCLLKRCTSLDFETQFQLAQLLEQCLTKENRSYVANTSLQLLVNLAGYCAKDTKIDYTRIGIRIIEQLFKHSSETCFNVVSLGGLHSVLHACRKEDVETLRHCAMALANLSLFGGDRNHTTMINRNIHKYLVQLANDKDAIVKYYAMLVVAVLVTNKEIEVDEWKLKILDLIEPFVTSHDPSEFSKLTIGCSKDWLKHLVRVLSSNSEKAVNLASFHFCIEAELNKERGSTTIFCEIGLIEQLKVVASGTNEIAATFAAKTLQLIPEKVPLWSVEDVRKWIKQIGFSKYEKKIKEFAIDGDLLLRLDEEDLREDICMDADMCRNRFIRELENLKQITDYCCKDTDGLNNFLNSIGQELCTYTYSMIMAGIDIKSVINLTDQQLYNECEIKNPIHRQKILRSIGSFKESVETTVLISYQKDDGDGYYFADLLKNCLQMRSYKVSMDVDKLEIGQCNHFLVVLTTSSLESSIQYSDFHQEILAAIDGNCNIIPITYNFIMQSEKLPEAIKSLSAFNSIRWTDDYQDACVKRIEEFICSYSCNHSDGCSTWPPRSFPYQKYSMGPISQQHLPNSLPSTPVSIQSKSNTALKHSRSSPQDTSRNDVVVTERKSSQPNANRQISTALHSRSTRLPIKKQQDTQKRSKSSESKVKNIIALYENMEK